MLYEWIIKNRPISTDLLYDLNPERFEDKVENLKKIAFYGKKNTLRWFYGSILITVILLMGISLLTEYCK